MERRTPLLKHLKIVSGGQTGADQAALNWAIKHGLPHGGWCPKGRWAEDGIIDERYSLTETPGSDPAQRTEWNIRDSDATVIFSTRPELIGGSRLTAELAQKLGKSWLWLARDREGHESAKKLADFIVAHRITVLNVAGPRASEESETQQFVQQVLLYALSAKH